MKITIYIKETIVYKTILFLFFAALVLTSCTPRNLIDTDNISSAEISNDNSQNEVKEISEWIVAHIEDFRNKYRSDNECEIIFADLGDDSVPDMFVRRKVMTPVGEKIVTSYTGYKDSLVADHTITMGSVDVFENSDPLYSSKLVEKNSVKGALWCLDWLKDYDYYVNTYGDNTWFDIDKIEPDDYVEERMTSTLSFTERIFNKKEVYGLLSITSNSQALFSFSIADYAPKIQEKVDDESDMKFISDRFIKECNDFYCEETELYEFFAAEREIVDIVLGENDYIVSPYDGGSFYILSKEDYEKLYAEYETQFKETEFLWVYRSGWHTGEYSQEWLDKIADEANESYLKHLEACK